MDFSMNRSMRPLVNKTLLQDISVTIDSEEIERILATRNRNPTEILNTASDNLYTEFLEVLQSHTSNAEVLQTISDLSTCCTDALSVIKGLKSKVTLINVDQDTWLENERNTWRLLYVLYQDRLSMQDFDNEEILQYSGHSEKRCMQILFKKDSLVRETQLVIDWLECNAKERDDEVLHFSDSSSGWENTLHQLMSKDTIVFESSREIVTSLDPDAPEYQGKMLHDLDQLDEKNLCKRVMLLIRCGKLEEAQKLCSDCGHSWRGAMLEGWKLYHNPYYTELDGEMILDDEFQNNEPEEMEGNENRDIWKKIAWKYCNNPKLDPFDKASVGVYCGNLDVLLNVSNSWEDYLWSYLKVMIDIKVESELRDTVQKKYQDLPEEYWNQRMSLTEIFTKLENSSNCKVKDESVLSDYIIQKYIILDEIPQLFEAINNFCDESAISTQHLRFLTHLVIFLEQIGRSHNRNIVEKVIEKYIRRLIQMRETQLVAFYVSKVAINSQVHIFAGYLENIVDNNERKASLEHAESCGLNVFDITKQIVENIRAKPQDLLDFDHLQQKITPLDEFKISSIDWLLFYDGQRAEALVQSNAFIFTFITMKKLDGAQLVFNKIPTDIVDSILTEESSEFIQLAIKEYLSYKTYLDAQEAFSVWFKAHKSRPPPPAALPSTAHFTERVAHEHRTSQHKADVHRWRLTTGHQAKTARTTLYNVLLFPDGGWLSGGVASSDSNRDTEGDSQGDYLRAICIPECVLLLYSVLHESGEYQEAVQLADVVMSEKYQLYKVYSKEKLAKIFMKLAESSSALLNEKKDPFGGESTV